jgi:arylsulfatase A-like enzyme
MRNGKIVENRFDRTARFTTDRAIQWLDHARDPNRPFYLFVHYFDAHAPYEPPAPYDTRFANDGKNHGATELERKVIDGYDGDIAYVDTEMGRLLDRVTALGLDADTIVVVVADHGEGLSEHGVWGHTADIYEELVRVPLVFRWPGRVRAGSAVQEPVALVDVEPTLLELIGLPADGAPLSGRSLAATLRDGAALDPGRPIYFQRRNYDRPTSERGVPVVGAQYGVREGRWKWIEGTRDGMRALFDLEQDPDETVNRAGNEPAKAASLAERLASWRKERTPQAAPARPLSADEAEKLRALGYAE